MYEGQPLKNDVEKFMKKSKFFKIVDTAFGEYGDQLYLNSLYYSRFNSVVIYARTKTIIKFLKTKVIVILKFVKCK